MNNAVEPKLDPVVDRVRNARDRLARECDYDLGALIRMLRDREAGHSERLVDPIASRRRQIDEESAGVEP